MPKTDLQAAQDAISAWPESIDTTGVVGDICRRLRDALLALAKDHSDVGWRDIAGLVRQLILSDQHAYGGQSQVFVPSKAPWPAAEQWAEVRCQALPVSDGRFKISALPFEPGFGEGENARVLGKQAIAAVYRGERSPEVGELAADPFWETAHSYGTYRGVAQQQAARAAVLNDGRPLIISLPTGRGKTAVAWSKALGSPRGVTVVVVPTVVLALDMERRTREQARLSNKQLSPLDRYAYTGSLDAASKRGLREAIRAGTQRILYTSPEAFVSGLSPAVIECARSGLLQQIVVDEAHLVDQWGDDFRPEFQIVPALTREAVDVAPADSKPSVLLMSATLAQRQVDTLSRLFAQEGDVDLLWGSALRQEPAYFAHQFTDEEERHQAVVDAISMLPRPAILYTTTVDDANSWAADLKKLGLSRVGVVTGQSPDHERETAIEKWRGIDSTGRLGPTQFDIIVGTSAFGLGVDVPNVRTVIHACLPESIDRYYQEVGRAGRDGVATIATLLAGPHDRKIAESLAGATFIGIEKGWRRWQSLMENSVQLEGFGVARYRVKKSSLPTYMDRGFGRSSQWNVRTLTLMAQAGVIALRTPGWRAPASLGGAEADAVREAFFEEASDLIDFELLDGALLSRAGWTAALENERERARVQSRASLARVTDLITGTQCVGRLLAGHYRVRALGGGEYSTHAVCRSCPWCRQNTEAATGLSEVEYALPRLPNRRSVANPLKRWTGESPMLYIALSDGDDSSGLLSKFSGLGVSVYYGLAPDVARALQSRAGTTPVILGDDVDGDSMPLALYHLDSLVFVLNDQNESLALERVGLGLSTYVVGPHDRQDPQRPGWKYVESRDHVIGGGVLLKEL